MISQAEQNGVTWIDLSSPSKKDIRHVIDQYDIPVLLGERLSKPVRTPSTASSEGKLLFTLHFPLLSNKSETDRFQVDFILGETFVLTSHPKTIDVLEKFKKKFEADTLVGKRGGESPAALLFCALIQEMYARLEDQLEGIEDRLESAEDLVFQGGEKKMVFTLSDINKDLLDFKQIVRLHQSLFDKFDDFNESDIPATLRKKMPKIYSKYQNIWNTILAHRETLEELRQTNDSLLSARTNQIVKILTIITFATYPSIFISGLFGMNVQNAPIVGNPSDFWIVLSIIAVITTLILSFFVHKKWF